jgi:aminopeptidase N
MIFYIWQDLEWFFEIYLRQPELPVLVSSRESNILNIHWEVLGNYSFSMPISKTDFFFNQAEKKRVTFTFDEKGCIESLSYIDNQRNITYKKVD